MKAFYSDIFHARYGEKTHQFHYRSTYLLLDCDNLQEADSFWFKVDRFAPLSVKTSDYLHWSKDQTLREKVEKELQKHQEFEKPAKIYLLTAPRFFGYVFNPVSYYFCYNQKNQFYAMLAEVNNTFYERYVYTLTKEQITEQSDNFLKFRVPKDFHVSPFYKIEGDYEFYAQDIQDQLDVRMKILKEEQQVFFASIAGKATAFEGRDILKFFFNSMQGSLLTMPRILYQAFKLYRKKVKYVAKPMPVGQNIVRVSPRSWVQGICEKLVCRELLKIRRGALTLVYPDKEEKIFGDSQAKPVKINIHDYEFFWQVVKAGNIGFGEAYTSGLWSVDNLKDLPEVLKLFVNNYADVKESRMNYFKPTRWFNYLKYILSYNSVKGSKHNISAHYDLNNDFFASFLDPSMTYSSGVYATAEDTLETAQKNKLDLLIDKARIKAEHRVLEIGCGWGGFAMRAQEKTNCHLDCLTISEEQYKFAYNRFAQLGIENKVNLHLKDYRKMQGQFDRIVSIEMLEAVGYRYLGQFFATCERLLKPNGIVALQVITYPDQLYNSYKLETDWIQKYIFPGSHLPSISALSKAIKNNSDFVIQDIENIGMHYARTLYDWRQTFQKNVQERKYPQYDDYFIKLWDYYLASCEAVFATGWINVQQLVLSRPYNPDLEETIYSQRGQNTAPEEKLQDLSNNSVLYK